MCLQYVNGRELIIIENHIFYLLLVCDNVVYFSITVNYCLRDIEHALYTSVFLIYKLYIQNIFKEIRAQVYWCLHHSYI